MVEPNTYCRVSGMVMEAIVLCNREGRPLPSVIEIGTAEGLGTMRYGGFCRLVIGVDTMQKGRPDVVSYKKEDLKPDEGLIAAFSRHTCDIRLGQPGGHDPEMVRLVVGSSSWPETLSKVEWYLAGVPADILVIDGVHHPASAVRRDFDMYERLVRSGGFVIFDDLYEKDIENIYVDILGSGKYSEVERWTSSAPDTLQDVGLLRKA